MNELKLQAFFDQGKLPNYQYQHLDEQHLNQYVGLVPSEFMELWTIGGLGPYMNHFFWVVNPSAFMEPFTKIYRPFEQPCIPFARDAFGGIFAWENGYIIYVDVRHGIVKTLGGGNDDSASIFFNVKATDNDYFSKSIDLKNFLEAQQRMGPINENECFGYFPLLALGGKEEAEKLQKVKLLEHYELIVQLAGQIT